MGGILSSFSEEGIDEYITTPDDTWSTVELDDGRVPKTHRLKNVSASLMDCSEGSAAGRVAQGLISHACSSRGIEADISVPDATCIHLALNEILESFHDENLICMKVPKDEHKIMQCISSGYPVSVVLPVTSEILERSVETPHADSEVFAFMPVILWGYSSLNKRFAAFVPLSVYEDAIAIPFSHVMHEDSCDLYVVDVVDEGDEGHEGDEGAEGDEGDEGGASASLFS